MTPGCEHVQKTEQTETRTVWTLESRHIQWMIDLKNTADRDELLWALCCCRIGSNHLNGIRLVQTSNVRTAAGTAEDQGVDTMGLYERNNIHLQ
jgi:hypothetical protein